MAKYDISKFRNVGIIGDQGEGKTSIAEAILFNAGVTDRIGRTDMGNSVMDYEPEEIKRKISITSSISHYEWNKHKIDIIDTPGDLNFLYESKSSLYILEGAIFNTSAASPIRVQGERAWGFANDFEVSMIVFINKMDKERADFLKTVENLKTTLNANIIPIQLPIGSESSFIGVIDIINMKAFRYNDDLSGKYVEEEVPKEVEGEILKLRENLIDNICEANDELLEKYLDTGEISIEEIYKGLRNGVIERRLYPAMCGSAVKNIGISQLMDAVNMFLPSIMEGKAIKGINPTTNEPEERIGEDAPFSAYVFKTIVDPFAGKLTVFKVYSGILDSDSNVYNSTKVTRERIGQILKLDGKKQKPVDSAVAGSIAVVAKLKETSTGDTLCEENNPIIFEKCSIPQPLISFAITPKSKGDEEKVTASLAKLREEDQTLSIQRDPQTIVFLLLGMGQIHLEVTVEKLKSKFGVEVELKTPKVPYKETIKSTTKIQGKYKKQSGGRGQYGDTWLELEPLPRGEGFEFVDKIVGGAIPKQYIPAVEKGIVEAMNEGVLAGYPIVDVKVTLYDGSYHVVDSSDLAFKIAASMGFKKGVLQCNPVLLEPIMNMEIIVPEDNMGDVIGDINSRRGRILGIESKSNNQLIKAQVPMPEVLK
jgi:elongation factor G